MELTTEAKNLDSLQEHIDEINRVLRVNGKTEIDKNISEEKLGEITKEYVVDEDFKEYLVYHKQFIKLAEKKGFQVHELIKKCEYVPLANYLHSQVDFKERFVVSIEGVGNCRLEQLRILDYVSSKYLDGIIEIVELLGNVIIKCDKRDSCASVEYIEKYLEQNQEILEILFKDEICLVEKYVNNESFWQKRYSNDGIMQEQWVRNVLSFIYVLQSKFVTIGDILYFCNIRGEIVITIFKCSFILVITIACDGSINKQFIKLSPKSKAHIYLNHQEIVKTNYDMSSLLPEIREMKASVSGRAVIGGILGGTTGAMVGALSAMEKNTAIAKNENINKNSVVIHQNKTVQCSTFSITDYMNSEVFLSGKYAAEDKLLEVINGMSVEEMEFVVCNDWMRAINLQFAKHLETFPVAYNTPENIINEYEQFIQQNDEPYWKLYTAKKDIMIQKLEIEESMQILEDEECLLKEIIEANSGKLFGSGAKAKKEAQSRILEIRHEIEKLKEQKCNCFMKNIEKSNLMGEKTND